MTTQWPGWRRYLLFWLPAELHVSQTTVLPSCGWPSPALSSERPVWKPSPGLLFSGNGETSPPWWIKYSTAHFPLYTVRWHNGLVKYPSTHAIIKCTSLYSNTYCLRMHRSRVWILGTMEEVVWMCRKCMIEEVIDVILKWKGKIVCLYVLNMLTYCF